MKEYEDGSVGNRSVVCVVDNFFSLANKNKSEGSDQNRLDIERSL